MISKNEIIKIEITSYSHDGQGVGKYGHMPVFVPYTARGDVVNVRVLKVLKNLAYAKIENIINPSPYRVDVKCKVFSKCGGCNLLHLSYDEQLYLKQQAVQFTMKKAGLDISVDDVVPSPKCFGYRNKVQVPFGIKNGQVVCGYYRENSHDIVDYTDCLLHSENANNIIKKVKNWCIDSGVLPYNESEHSGVLRHLFIREGKNTQTVLVVKREIKDTPDIENLMLNINAYRTNQIMGRDFISVRGDEYVIDTLLGVDFNISPQSFYQINKDQAENIYKKVTENLSGKTVFDMYSGIGTISLIAGKVAKSVVGVEININAVENAKKAAKANNIKNVEFICGDVSEVSKELKKCDTLIVDPPRKGCDQAFFDSVEKIAPSEIFYVSCNPSTLARDLVKLTQMGYEIEYITPYDMFPQTAHVECVAYAVKK